jgi:ribosomal silencing factor RsfS
MEVIDITDLEVRQRCRHLTYVRVATFTSLSELPAAMATIRQQLRSLQRQVIDVSTKRLLR